MIVTNYEMRWENNRAVPRPGSDADDNASRMELADCVTHAYHHCNDAYKATSGTSEQTLSDGAKVRCSNAPAERGEFLADLESARVDNAKISYDKPGYHVDLGEGSFHCYGSEGLFDFSFRNGVIAVIECS